MTYDAWRTRAPEHDEPELYDEAPICERCGRAECTPEDFDGEAYLCVDCDHAITFGIAHEDDRPLAA